MNLDTLDNALSSGALIGHKKVENGMPDSMTSTTELATQSGR